MQCDGRDIDRKDFNPFRSNKLDRVSEGWERIYHRFGRQLCGDREIRPIIF